MDSEITPMTRGATDEPAEHVLAIGVAGGDSLCDQETDRARVIGDRSIRNVAFFIFAVRAPVADFLYAALNFFDDRLEQIDIVVAEDLACLEALQGCRGAFEAGAGIDVLL